MGNWKVVPFGVFFCVLILVILAFGFCVFNTSYFLNRHCVCRLALGKGCCGALGDGDP
jgi:hypothetical protein